MKSEYLNRKVNGEATGDPDISTVVSALADIKYELEKLSGAVEVADTGYKGTDEACKYVGCSRDTLYRKVKANELTMYKLGSKTLFKTDELNSLPQAVAQEGA